MNKKEIAIKLFNLHMDLMLYKSEKWVNCIIFTERLIKHYTCALNANNN